MNFVAKKPFVNVQKLALKIDRSTPGFEHPKHVHKGHRFVIGSAPNLKGLSKSDRDLAVALISSESALPDDPANALLIAQIDVEVQIERARQTRQQAALPAPRQPVNAQE